MIWLPDGWAKAVIGGSLMAALVLLPAATEAPAESAPLPFYGEHQPGIVTPPPGFVYFVAYDLTTLKKTEVQALLKSWTVAAAQLMAGKPVGDATDNRLLPPADTGEAEGLSAAHVTITVGAGPSLFDKRFGLEARRPPALADLPAFADDQLRAEWCGGDLGVQVCADDQQVAFHAMRNLTRLARGVAVLRWTQAGFVAKTAVDPRNETPRNLQGFKDGTDNPNPNDTALMNQVVWAQSTDGPRWMVGGSYLVVRKIQIRVEAWDRDGLKDQENVIGRQKNSGAPLGGLAETDFLGTALTKKTADGQPVIPDDAHVRLARGDGSVKILRRGYSFANGLDFKTGQLDAGLLFLAFQKDPRYQFVVIQKRLAGNDALNEYIQHVGSAVFAVFPGTQVGGYLGKTLLD
jgi:deferrochelatase/peroxidase EfeB